MRKAWKIRYFQRPTSEKKSGVMIRRVLVALDGSPESEGGMSLAERWFAARGVEIVLAQNVEAVPLERRIGTADTLRDEGRPRAEGRGRAPAQAAIPIGSEPRGGGAVSPLGALAGRVKADLLLFPGRTRSGLDALIYGSAVWDLARSSPVPVLGVPADGAGAPPPGRIVAPFDGSAGSRPALAMAERVARFFDCEIVFLTVCEGPAAEPWEGARAGPPSRKGRAADEPEPACAAAEEAARRGLRSRAVVWNGDPAARILEAPRVLRAGAVVMATHGRAGEARWTLGSVTETVLRNAVFPVLVVSPAAAEASGGEGEVA